MFVQMVVPDTFLPELFRAQVALVLLFRTMDIHVVLEGSFPGKLLLADVALEGLYPRVELHVHPHVALLGEHFAADAALVTLCFSVAIQVHLQPAFNDEGLPTDDALVCDLLRVALFHVFLQELLLHEHRLTVSTFILLFSTPGVAVRLQTCLGRESPVALGASNDFIWVVEI